LPAPTGGSVIGPLFGLTIGIGNLMDDPISYP
jgi:hypothetical protein